MREQLLNAALKPPKKIPFDKKSTSSSRWLTKIVCKHMPLFSAGILHIGLEASEIPQKRLSLSFTQHCALV